MNNAKTALDEAEQAIKKGTLGWFEKNNSDKAVKVINDHKNDPFMNTEDSTVASSRTNLDVAINGVKNIIATNKLRQSDSNFTGLADLKVDDYLMATAWCVVRLQRLFGKKIQRQIHIVNFIQLLKT